MTEKFECLARGYLLFEKGWMKLVSGGREKGKNPSIAQNIIYKTMNVHSVDI
jgi:hypothetical protein